MKHSHLARCDRTLPDVCVTGLDESYQLARPLAIITIVLAVAKYIPYQEQFDCGNEQRLVFKKCGTMTGGPGGDTYL